MPSTARPPGGAAARRGAVRPAPSVRVDDGADPALATPAGPRRRGSPAARQRPRAHRRRGQRGQRHPRVPHPGRGRRGAVSPLRGRRAAGRARRHPAARARSPCCGSGGDPAAPRSPRREPNAAHLALAAWLAAAPAGTGRSLVTQNVDDLHERAAGTDGRAPAPPGPVRREVAGGPPARPAARVAVRPRRRLPPGGGPAALVVAPALPRLRRPAPARRRAVRRAGRAGRAVAGAPGRPRLRRAPRRRDQRPRLLREQPAAVRPRRRCPDRRRQPRRRRPGRAPAARQAPRAATTSTCARPPRRRCRCCWPA